MPTVPIWEPDSPVQPTPPLVVMAGHSAFLSLDGPVHVIGPTGVLVAPVVQP
jgi:hypothetical protein